MKSYYKFLFTFSSFLGLLTISFILFASNAFADPNALLGEAIKNASKLKGKLPTKERLKAYENIFKSLDKIVAEHGSSDQAIKILSDQKIGNFDPPNLRNKYIKELTDYYDTVCEASPSYSCLGFVSLKTGNDQCKTASDLDGIIEAHFNLKNAARVFFGQKGNDSYISLAMDSYRSCLIRSKFKATTFAKDLFSSEMIDLLLKSKQESLAKGAIENMETPVLKFKGVLALSKHNKKPFDEKYFKRLSKYIEKKIDNKEGGKALAIMTLMLSALQRSSLPLDFSFTSTLDSSLGGAPFGVYDKKCDHFIARDAFDTLTKLQWEVAHTKDSRIKLKQKFGSITNAKSYKLYLIEKFARFPGGRDKSALNACSDNGLYNYKLMNLIYGRLMMDNDLVANEFKRRAIKEHFTERQQLEFFFNHMGQSKKKFKKLCIPNIDDPNSMIHCSEKVPGQKQLMVKQGAMLDKEIFKAPGSNYLIFTKKVDFSEVCEASTILFKQLKGGDEYDDAIKYMINSPNVDPEHQYKCGDEDLELLLN